MEQKYPLYYTLNKNIAKTKMTKAQEQKLLQKLRSVDGDAKKATIMLIAEYSRVVDGQAFDSPDASLPYEGVQDGNDASFDLKNFPLELKWILWKFVHLDSSAE